MSICVYNYMHTYIQVHIYVSTYAKNDISTTATYVYLYIYIIYSDKINNAINSLRVLTVFLVPIAT